MLAFVVQYWISLASIFLVICVLLPLEVEAQQPYSTNANDYEFGWFTTGLLDAGQLPVCKYCINALGDGELAADTVMGRDWNRTVGLYRCDGVQNDEVWAYQNSTGRIVYGNLSEKLCLDAVLGDYNVLKLRQCNSSVVTQQWTLENNSLMNGLVDSSGQKNYLFALPPDLETNPSNQNYTYQLFIASSQPSDGPYTSTFTFLPTTNLVHRYSETLSTEGLLQISNSAEGQITNGDFENSTILAGSTIAWSTWNQTFPSYFALCGWVIDYGPIDYVYSGYLKAKHGSYSIHLNTYTDVNHNGSISQTIGTETGKEYVLSFFMTGLPPSLQIPNRPTNCSLAYTEGGASLQVRVTNWIATGLLSNETTSITQNFTTSNLTGLVQSNIEESWSQKTVIFTALTNVTTISFVSLNINESCGPMIDMVEVSLKTRPSERKKVVSAVVGSIGGLAGLIAILSIVFGIRYCLPRENYSNLYKTEYARVYSVKELSIATKKFSSVLGEGGFGTVYKADFPNGTVGAVKVEKPRGPHSSSTVLASEEIAVLLRVHHRNLVNLTGFCIHKGRHMLVFEYLPNGSLYDRLHKSILPSPPSKSTDFLELSRLRSNVLSWTQRVKIVADVAWGLEYLHHEADPPIVHRDIKSQNILLTSTDFAKLADFGLSKAAPIDATSFQSIETAVKGSFGYMDPQYFSTGVFSPKCDVFSFGILLLEIISGHPAVYNATSLASWAAPYLTSPSLYHELIDVKLNGDFIADELNSLITLSKMCTQEDGKMRPTMRQVVAFLNSRHLPSEIGETSERMEETLSSESFHNMARALFNSESQSHDSSSGSWFA